MLALLFNRSPKRRIVGLLALGANEWASTSAGAISGSVSTRQTGQQDLIGAVVVEPIVVGFVGSGFGYGPPRAEVSELTGRAKTKQAKQRARSVAKLKFAATVGSEQTQDQAALGDLEFAGAVADAQHAQSPALLGELVLSGSVVSDQAPQCPISSAKLEFAGALRNAQNPQQGEGSAALVLSGFVETGQPGQHTRGSSGLELVGHARSSQPGQSVVAADFQFTGTASSHAQQASLLSGEMIDTELELVTAILLAA